MESPTESVISPSVHPRVREFAEAVSNSPAEVFTLDTDRIVTSHNKESSLAYGYTVPCIVGYSADEVLADDETRPARIGFINRVLAGESVPAFEQRRINAYGETVYVEIYGAPIRDEHGVIVGMFASARDVTELVADRRRVVTWQRMLDASQAAAHVGSWIADLDAGMIELSPEQCRLYGLDPNTQAVPLEYKLGLIHPDDQEAAAAILERRGDFTVEFRVVLPDGKVRTFWSRGAHEPGEHPSQRGRLLGVTRDVTDESAERIAREQAERELRMGFEAALIGVAMADVEGRVTRVNRSMCAMLGLSSEQLVGMTFGELLAPEAREAGLEAMRLMAGGNHDKDRETVRYQHPDGYSIWVEMAISRVTDADGTPLHFTVQAQDVTERHDYQDRLRYMVDHDAVTGLLNRSSFEQRLRKYLEARERGSNAALLLLDLDGLNAANRALGQLAGDHAAKEMGAGLSAALPAPHMLGRLGGTTFVVLLSDVDRIQAELIAVELCQEMADVVRRAGLERRQPITASVGIAFPDRTRRNAADQLMEQADAALSNAKAKGGNCYAVYSAPE